MDERFDRLYQTAVDADSLQDIITGAWQLLGEPVILSDSLHYIIALSPDLTEKYGASLVWSGLVSFGLVKPIKEGRITIDEARAAFEGKRLGSNILVHFSRLDSGRWCSMCDIMHGGSVILKLTVSTERDPDEAMWRFLKAASDSVYLAYFRLRYTTNTIIDGRSRFLLSLLRGDAGDEAVPYGGLSDFDLRGPFAVASLETGQMDTSNLALASVTAELSRLMNCSHLSVRDGNEYVFLLNVAEAGPDFWDGMDRYMHEHSIILGVSRQFGDLNQTGDFHIQASGAAAAAGRFNGFAGIAGAEEFSIFRMFDMISRQDDRQTLKNPAVQLLAHSDDTKNTDYLQTAFCWLLNSKKAVQTAGQLFIHRNTLDNRIARIGELIDPDWDSTPYRLGMLYSLYTILSERNQLIYYGLSR